MKKSFLILILLSSIILYDSCEYDSKTIKKESTTVVIIPIIVKGSFSFDEKVYSITDCIFEKSKKNDSLYITNIKFYTPDVIKDGKVVGKGNELAFLELITSSDSIPNRSYENVTNSNKVNYFEYGTFKFNYDFALNTGQIFNFDNGSIISINKKGANYLIDFSINLTDKSRIIGKYDGNVIVKQ